MEGWKGRMDGKDGLTDGQMERCMDGRIEGWTDGRIDRWMDSRMKGRIKIEWSKCEIKERRNNYASMKERESQNDNAQIKEKRESKSENGV
jgi:hypothetical protein